MNREQWLETAVTELRPIFKEGGTPLPKKVRIAMGLPFGTRKHVGQCFHSTCSKDGGREIWVSPVLIEAGAERILGTLIHELCHAALPDDEGHGRNFAALGKKMLLTGKPTCMCEGSAEFTEAYKPLLKKLRKFPGVEFDPGAGTEKKQKTYMIKIACEECEAVFRMTATWADQVVCCPCCQSDDVTVGG